MDFLKFPNLFVVVGDFGSFQLTFAATFSLNLNKKRHMPETDTFSAFAENVRKFRKKNKNKRGEGGSLRKTSYEMMYPPEV